MSDLIWRDTTVKLGSLKPWGGNPKTSTKKDARALLKSWDELGQFQTVAIGPDGDVYDGHQRLSALLTVHGPEYQIAARVSSRPLTDEERRKLAIYSRQIGQWDWDTLSSWNGPELREWGFDGDLLKDWKRDTAALDNFLKSEQAEPVDAEPQIDRAAELNEKWGVVTGDLWQIGPHRLLCGDSTKREDVERVMGGERAGACVTDSPYGINREGIENDDPEGLRALFDGVLACFPMDNGLIINFQSPRLFPVWLDAIRAAGQKFERALWFYDETDVTFPWRGWLMTSQIALVSSIGKPVFVEGVYHHDCYNVKSAGKQDDSGGHTTAKPLDVVQELISHIDGLVYEPFAGSGTALVACQNLSRVCRAIEISPAYCAVILERMSTAFPELEIKRIE